jgi:DNA-binding MarR family transcriptional regulator
MSVSAEDSARDVLEVVPLVIRIIRTEMRRNRSPALTVPQFRALVFIEVYPGTSVSKVAEHVGLTLPSASVLVDGLVQRNLVTRQPHPTDRRCVTLTLTDDGRAAVRVSRQHTQAFLAERLAGLSDAQRAKLVQAMDILRQAFANSE